MIRKIIKCDICGDTWDITDTDLSTFYNPGSEYRRRKIIDGSVTYILSVGNNEGDEIISSSPLDLCTGCYNKLDRFIFSMKEKKSERIHT